MKDEAAALAEPTALGRAFSFDGPPNREPLGAV